MLRIARRAAWSLHQHGVASTVAPALRLRSGARDAVGLDRAGRTANVADNLQLATDRMPPEGVPVVLVDDVVTSGATARACVRALHNAGASVTAVVAMTSAQR